MNTLLALITGTGLGSLAMYVLDPLAGKRRRALARDQLIRLQTKAKEAAAVTARDLKNRTWGTLAEGRTAIFGETVDDAVLAERVRSKLGFLVRYPSHIDVQASAGRVTLSGPVLADEVQQLTRGVAAVRAVRDVENRLEVHEKADEVPGFQGNLAKPSGETIDLWQRRWAPSTWFLVGSAGATLLFLANRRVLHNLAPLSALVGVGCLFYGLSDGNSEVRQQTQGSARAEAGGGWPA
ncbi:MAG TPA: BON domain-containing protein [Candidatus Udaeobacter sp.]|jgi:hypothetical protein|nr:BON domain-containing protein [Candidatus Udaeobacter sp.]